MIRTRLGRVALAALAAIALVSGMATPAVAATGALGDPDTFGGQVRLAPSGTPVGAAEATITLERWLNGARTPIPGATATTDAGGNYLITGLPSGVAVYPTVTYTGSGPYERVLTTLNTVSNRVYNPTLKLAYRFTGHVDLSADGSADGASVGADEVEVRLRWTGNSGSLAVTRTDASGNYAFDRVPIDQTVFLEFRYLGDDLYPPWYENGDGIGTREISQARKVTLSEDRVADVVIGAGAGVSGTILGTDGEPVAGMTVSVSAYVPVDGGGDHVRNYTVLTDSEGNYVVRGVDPQYVYGVTWSAPGYSYGRNGGGSFYKFHGFVDVEPFAVSTGVDGVLYVEGKIQMKVRRGWGLPSDEDAYVMLYAYDELEDVWDESGLWATDDFGNVTFRYLNPGLYAVDAVYSGSLGYNSIASSVFEIEEGEVYEYNTWIYAGGNPNNIHTQYTAFGGAAGPLGASLPGGGTITTKGGGVIGYFENGTMYTSRYGTWVVWNGPIADLHRTTGGVPGTYGWPTSEETCGGEFCAQSFQGGTIAPTYLSKLTGPSLSGTYRVGATITAAPGTYSPAATVWTYTWFRDGSEIAGATTAKYVPTAEDLGHSLSVEVEASRPGKLPVVSTSPGSPVITDGAQSPAPVPTISGVVQVGKTLTAKTGTWSPGTTFEYQWSASGTPIPDAVASTYVLAPGDVGKRITVAVTASRPAYVSLMKTSAASVAVLPTAFLTAPVPTIAGTPQVGQELTAVPGTWAPAAEFRYQWYADAVAIKNATSSTFTPPGTLRGKRITVRVTGIAQGYVSLSKTSARTAALAVGVWAATPVPEVTGDLRVGSTLTASTSGWPAHGTFAYQWLAGGIAVPKATGRTFVPTATQLGKPITVRITTTSPGYPRVILMSSPSAVVEKGEFALAPAPTISGAVRYLSPLKAVPGAWSPSATLTYQWRSDGVAIPKATLPTYTPSLATLGTSLTVLVTAKRSGFTTLERESDAVVVAPAGFATTPVPKISGTVRVGSKLTATPGVWSKPAVLSYQWSAGGVEIAGATGSAFVLTADQVGQPITVSVTGTASNYTIVTKTSAATAAVPAIP